MVDDEALCLAVFEIFLSRVDKSRVVNLSAMSLDRFMQSHLVFRRSHNT